MVWLKTGGLWIVSLKMEKHQHQKPSSWKFFLREHEGAWTSSAVSSKPYFLLKAWVATSTFKTGEDEQKNSKTENPKLRLRHMFVHYNDRLICVYSTYFNVLPIRLRHYETSANKRWSFCHSWSISIKAQTFLIIIYHLYLFSLWM